MNGNAYVNEANLTGESYPVGKFAISSFRNEDDSRNIHDNREIWLYEGSLIFEKSNDLRAVVIYTGFSTKKGRIVRRILTRETKEPKIFWSALLFLV